VTALPAEHPAPQVLLPYWLSAADREELARAVRDALMTCPLHPVLAVRLQDVLTELHIAAARDAVWPATAARVRMATGWGADVLPVRLSADERAGVLTLATLPDGLRAALGGAPV
jgi:hypothetical protein